MTIHLPEDLERYVQSQVQSGYFASEDEAITEAVRLLRQDRSAAASTRSQRPSEEELERQMVQSGFLWVCAFPLSLNDLRDGASSPSLSRASPCRRP